MESQRFVELLSRERATAILRWGDQGQAAEAMEAAYRGGFRILEFTLTTPGVYELIRDFSQRPGAVVGAGTVLDPEQARRAVDAGARFVVSPVVDETVIGCAAELGVAALPGAHTPTEMLQAHHFGAPLIKLFPCPAGGPVWLRSVLGPLPFLKVVPTNGVDEHDFARWLDAGAWAAGFVASLFDAGDMAAGRWSAIEARAERILAARPAPPPA
ncbi:MAG: 2-dehydro-3-deoxyphosphogluconate aldolase [Acidobacteriota bacterium]